MGRSATRKKKPAAPARKASAPSAPPIPKNVLGELLKLIDPATIPDELRGQIAAMEKREEYTETVLSAVEKAAAISLEIADKEAAVEREEGKITGHKDTIKNLRSEIRALETDQRAQLTTAKKLRDLASDPTDLATYAGIIERFETAKRELAETSPGAFKILFAWDAKNDKLRDQPEAALKSALRFYQDRIIDDESLSTRFQMPPLDKLKVAAKSEDAKTTKAAPAGRFGAMSDEAAKHAASVPA